jgi:intracellular sulfur oxidation DsrE/DsrF family protein
MTQCFVPSQMLIKEIFFLRFNINTPIMKRTYILTLLLLLFSGSVFAQEIKSHRIVIQVASNDTTVQAQLMKQLGNLQKVSPGIQLEVVCHGPGLELLVSDKSYVAAKVTEHSKKGVDFVACEFTMMQKNIDKSRLIAGVRTVPAAILEIAEKQEQGWSYIKSGF